MNPKKKEHKSAKKVTRQGSGTFSKKFHNKRAKGYKKRYKGQGR